MTSGSSESGDEVVARRAVVLRELCQGEGLTLEKLKAVPDLEELFGTNRAQELLDLIRQASYSLLDDEYGKAIRNALNLEETPDTNLTERRFEFASVEDVKPRTLINHEQRGAELLARQIEVVRNLRSKDDAVDELTERVKHLENHLYSTNLLLSALVQILATSGLSVDRTALVAYHGGAGARETDDMQFVTDDEDIGIGKFGIAVRGDAISQVVVPTDGLRLIDDYVGYIKKNPEGRP